MSLSWQNKLLLEIPPRGICRFGSEQSLRIPHCCGKSHAIPVCIPWWGALSPIVLVVALTAWMCICISALPQGKYSDDLTVRELWLALGRAFPKAPGFCCWISGGMFTGQLLALIPQIKGWVLNESITPAHCPQRFLDLISCFGLQPSFDLLRVTHIMDVRSKTIGPGFITWLFPQELCFLVMS